LDTIGKTHPSAIKIFLDIQAAYDTVDREILWSKLAQQFGLSMKWISILRTLFDYNKARIRIAGTLSQGVTARRGLLQGSSLSPLLFNAYFIFNFASE
jgi:hypothetical protein